MLSFSYKEHTIITAVRTENGQYIPAVSILWEAIDGSWVKHCLSSRLRSATEKAAEGFAVKEAKAWIDAHVMHMGP